MIVKFHGSQTLAQFIENLGAVVNDIKGRADLTTEEKDIKLKDVQVGVTFNIGGTDSFLEVNHGDIAEVFTVNVKLDEAGQIDVTKDNEKETFLDDYTRAIAKGEEVEYQEIESVYDDDMLVWEKTNDGGDIKEVIYTDAPTGHRVVRYYKNDVLVGECAYTTENAEVQS